MDTIQKIKKANNLFTTKNIAKALGVCPSALYRVLEGRVPREAELHRRLIQWADDARLDHVFGLVEYAAKVQSEMRPLGRMSLKKKMAQSEKSLDKPKDKPLITD